MPGRVEAEKIQTFSLIAGSQACDALCPFCVSKMTPEQGMTLKAENINRDRFKRAYEYAAAGKAETAMITGKGEPVLFPDHITEYLNYLLESEKDIGYRIRVKELQTNGIKIAEGKVDDRLYLWRAGNLHTIAVSIVHFEPEVNREIFLPQKDSYIDLPKLIDKLHQADFSVRLACVLFNGGIDNSGKLKRLIEFSKDNQVEQLTIRPVDKPAEVRNPEIAQWVEEHSLKKDQLEDMAKYLEENGIVMREFPFGGRIYSIFDIRHQNVCLTTCLTKDQSKKYLRQLIFYPNGRIAPDWTEEGEGLK